MFTKYGRMIVWIALVILVAGCGRAEPTAVSVLPPNTPLPPTARPDATSLPPAETPLPPTTEPGVVGEPWFKTFGGDLDDVCDDVLLADDGGFFLVGTTNLQFEPEMQGDVYLIRTDAAGDVLWERIYEKEGYQGGLTISRTGDSRSRLAMT